MTALALLAADGSLPSGVISMAGWILGVGGLLLAALWLHYLYR